MVHCGSIKAEDIRNRTLRRLKTYNIFLHVPQWPDKFHFGQSEWIYERDVVPSLQECFKVVLIAHDVAADIKHLTELGFDVTRMVSDCIDISDLYKAAHQDARQSALSTLLLRYSNPRKPDDQSVAESFLESENDFQLKLDRFITVAVRKEPLRKRVVVKSFSHEKLYMLHHIRHDNFVAVLESFNFEGSFYVILERMNISLVQIVASPPYPGEQELAAILGQVDLADGMSRRMR